MEVKEYGVCGVFTCGVHGFLRLKTTGLEKLVNYFYIKCQN